MLQKITLGGRACGFTYGPKGFIVSTNEFILGVYKPNETASLNIGEPFKPVYKDFSLQDLKGVAGAPLSMFDWGHYWGIKQRMAGNYAGLLASMREIGLGTKDMPRWGEDDRAKAA